MRTKTIKILTIILAIVTILMSTSVTSYSYSPSDVVSKNNTALKDMPQMELEKLGNNIIGIIQVIGIIISVMVLMILGIKYMMGSASERAEYKKTMIPYLVGAILIFAATTIANIVYQFAIGL